MKLAPDSVLLIAKAMKYKISKAAVGPSKVVVGYGQHFQPKQRVEAIFKVVKPNYVPAFVKLRSRIDPQMFTGEVEYSRLNELNSDSDIVSVAVSKPLDLVY